MILERAAGASSDTMHRLSLSRRTLLKAGAAAGGGLVLGLTLPSASADAEGFRPNAFVRIQGDGKVVLTMPYVEMGQGTYTSIPMLLAEELEVDLRQVRLEHAPPNPRLYGNPIFGGMQSTGGSTSIRAAWQPLREAGAIARTMLVAAAAQRWNVDPLSCRAQSDEVLHVPSGRKISYGAIAAAAARLPVPQSVPLKRPADFKLIGTPAKRLDTPEKVNGTAVFGIDVRVPGMKIATLRQSPVFGGRVKSIDDSTAKAVKGVRQIVRLDDAVAVVAEHFGAAKGIGRASHRMGPRFTRKTHHGRDRERARKGDTPIGGGCAEHGQYRRDHGSRRQKGRGNLSSAIPGARCIGADELHRACSQGWV